MSIKKEGPSKDEKIQLLIEDMDSLNMPKVTILTDIRQLIMII